MSNDLFWDYVLDHLKPVTRTKFSVMETACEPFLEIPHKAGAIYHAEGCILYGLIRLFKPNKIVELGTFSGTASNYMIQAAYDNKKGHFLSVENRPKTDPNYLSVLNKELVNLCPEKEIKFIASQDAFSVLSQIKSCDFIFEDTDHGDMTKKLIPLAVEKLNPGGILISHDILIEEPLPYGKNVAKAYEMAGIYLQSCIVPTKCGLIIWRKPF